QPVHKTALDASLFEGPRHLLAATMNEDQFVIGRDCRELTGNCAAAFRVPQKRATYFDENLHKSPCVSGKPSIRFMFCTACPAAPFTRLSMQLNASSRVPLSSSRGCTRQRFEPQVCLVAGGCATMRVNGSSP